MSSLSSRPAQLSAASVPRIASPFIGFPFNELLGVLCDQHAAGPETAGSILLTCTLKECEWRPFFCSPKETCEFESRLVASSPEHLKPATMRAVNHWLLSGSARHSNGALKQTTQMGRPEHASRNSLSPETRRRLSF